MYALLLVAMPVENVPEIFVPVVTVSVEGVFVIVVVIVARSIQVSVWIASPPVASTKRIEGAPELYSVDVSAYVWAVPGSEVAVIVIRLFHVAGGVRTWTFTFSSAEW